jgi:hypothetical protein
VQIKGDSFETSGHRSEPGPWPKSAVGSTVWVDIGFHLHAGGTLLLSSAAGRVALSCTLSLDAPDSLPASLPANHSMICAGGPHTIFRSLSSALQPSLSSDRDAVAGGVVRWVNKMVSAVLRSALQARSPAMRPASCCSQNEGVITAQN